MQKSYHIWALKLAVAATMLVSATGYSYLDRHEAIKESSSIIYRLFSLNKLDEASKIQLTYFINDFNKNTFSYGVAYSQFNEENVAGMVIDSAAEWIAQQSVTVAIREVMTDSTFNPHFNGANYFNQEPLKKAIHRAILAQVKRVSKKPLEYVNCGDFNGFIGTGLRLKVREQISAMIGRDCGAYCDNKGPKMLLYCGHMLHRECYAQLQKPAKCPQCRDSLAYLAPAQSVAAYQSKPSAPPAQQSAYKPSAPQPVYQPQAQPAYQPSQDQDFWDKFFISIGFGRRN